MRGGPAVALLLLACLATGPRSAADEAADGSAAPAVVLELFTSQGCSSCPTADRVLRRLGREGVAGGPLLVPLAFHVDYWNRLGWTDPFSSARWSARQRRYAEVFGARRVYTPQIVLNGRREMVGSHEGRVRSEIPAVAGRASGARIELSSPVVDAAAGELAIEVSAERRDADGPSRLVAMVALFENGLVTAIDAGENARRTLENDYVVRVLRPAFTLERGAGSRRRERLTIGLDPAWVAANLGVAAFLQDPESLEIHAAAARPRLAVPHPAQSM